MQSKRPAIRRGLFLWLGLCHRQGVWRFALLISLLSAAAWAQPASQPATEAYHAPIFGGDPEDVVEAASPRTFVLSAPWCQWCKVLKHEVLPDPEVQKVLADFEVYEVNVDRFPRWMDLRGVSGLPALVFMDQKGAHVFTHAGYRPVRTFLPMLEAVRDQIQSGALLGVAISAPIKRLDPTRRISPPAAARALKKWSDTLFIKVNSNDGGFESPARHPHPALLVALEEWKGLGAPRRVEKWIALTLENARRGQSPRLRGEKVSGMDFSARELTLLSKMGPKAGARWRQAIDALPNVDAFWGIRDPVDHGFFRYAAGPGWYHPHFERSAFDNLNWARLFALRGEEKESQRMLRFVDQWFLKDERFLTYERSDPFYHRLSKRERVGVARPRVDDTALLHVQATAALANPRHCGKLREISVASWPSREWDEKQGWNGKPAALPDQVGLFIEALVFCEGKDGGSRARAMAQLALARWKDQGFIHDGRLFVLARGIAQALPKARPAVLAQVADLPLSLTHPPPLSLMAKMARH
jgi:hypothetical protein